MALTILKQVPRLYALAADASFDCRTDAFISGQLVGVQAGGSAATLYGAAYDKTKPKRSARVVVSPVDLTVVAGGVGQSAATRDSNGHVTGTLTLTFGTVDGQVLDSLPTMSGTADRLSLSVWVNGVLYQRAADNTANPGVGAFSRLTGDARTVVIGASSADPLRVGTEIVIALAEELGQLAVTDSTGAYVAGGAVAANTITERRIGLAKATLDTAGRPGTALVEADVVVADAAVSLITITK